MDRTALNRELEQAQRTLARQSTTLAQTLAVIDAIKAPDGTAPIRIINKRNRQHTAVAQSETYIKRLQDSVKKAPKIV